MFITFLVFRNTLKLKSTVTGTPVLKNLFEKCYVRKFTNFRVICENSRSFFTTSQSRISITRFNKSTNAADKFEDARTMLNNVLIFKFERQTSYRVITAFAFIQLIGLFTMASNVYRTFCKGLLDETKSWRQRLASHPFSLFTIVTACFCGPIIFVSIIFFSSRTIRRIILHKGGEKVTIVTYNLLPHRRVFTESLENMSCLGYRSRRSTLPLTIKGKRFYYFIDTDGEIPNEQLFDFTVGAQRDLSNQ